MGAVWFDGAMGLLDDAIREHLELKRLRGADPGAVAREADDALGPVRRDDGDAEAQHPDSTADSPPSRKGSFFPGSEPALAADLSTTGQETAEIDMDAVLDPDRGVQHSDEDPGSERAAPSAPAPESSSAEESLEWEVPGERSDELTEHADDLDDQPDAAGQVEDVLEETPDFLRDTPEQERLWFEQRPPRDFDFNE